jgi:hypothetical protein
VWGPPHPTCLPFFLAASEALVAALIVYMCRCCAEGSYGGMAPAPADADTCPGGFNFGGLELVPAEDVLPIPDVARGLLVDPAVGFAMDEIANDTWIVTDGSYVLMFVVTSEGVVLFDAPQSLAVRSFLPFFLIHC